MSTRYRPYHEDGRVGPIFEFWTVAALWVWQNDRPGTAHWTVKPISSEPTLQEIQDALPKHDAWDGIKS